MQLFHFVENLTHSFESIYAVFNSRRAGTHLHTITAVGQPWILLKGTTDPLKIAKCDSRGFPCLK